MDFLPMKYGSVKDIVDNNAERFKQMAEHLESAFQELAQNGPPESVWDAVAPTIEGIMLQQGMKDAMQCIIWKKKI